MEHGVRLWVHPRQNVYHASKLYAGLLTLESQRRVRLEFASAREQENDALVIELDVARQGRWRRIAIDLYDRSDLFAKAALQRCDVYFKRSFYISDVNALDPAARAKVTPFGLNFACQRQGMAWRVLPRSGIRYGAEIARAALLDRTQLREELNAIKQFLTLPRAADFETAPDEIAQPIVLFQTRIWEPQQVLPDDPVQINETRVALVRALRHAFGDRFRGGLVPTPYARRMYPDAITNEASRRSAYIAMSRSALIGIYTRGLHHSAAFKLPEYLASCKTIVAEPIRNELPAPLVEGVNYLAFHDPAQCVEQCRRLLEDASLATSMRQENHQYYRQHVAPAAHVLSCLERAGA